MVFIARLTMFVLLATSVWLEEYPFADNPTETGVRVLGLYVTRALAERAAKNALLDAAIALPVFEFPVDQIPPNYSREFHGYRYSKPASLQSELIRLRAEIASSKSLVEIVCLTEPILRKDVNPYVQLAVSIEEHDVVTA